MSLTSTGIGHALSYPLSYPLTATYGLLHGLAAGLCSLAASGSIFSENSDVKRTVAKALGTDCSNVKNALLGAWTQSGASRLARFLLSEAGLRHNFGNDLSPQRASFELRRS